jgi:putative ABC transport system permease protein
MITKIALRNLTEHKSKSFIVGGLIALGVSLLVMGNSVMDSISAGMRASFTEQYSGDLFIFAPFENESELSIFGAMGNEQADPLERFDEFEAELSQQENVKLVSKMTVGMGTMESSLGEQALSVFWGVDPTAWSNSFAQHLTWHKGGLWKPGETGVAIPKTQADDLAKAQGAPVDVGDSVLITVMGESGISIRELPVTGIFEFKTISAPQMELLSLVDLQSSQELLSLDEDNNYFVELSDAETNVLGEVSDGDLFGSDDLFGGEGDNLFTEVETVSMDSLDDELAQTLKRTESAESGFVPQYHFAVVLLENPNQLTETQVAISEWAAEKDLNWRIGDWENAAGFIGGMANSIKAVLNGLVMIIAFVSTLIIMNTLVISVTERLQEIGTMRAIGAQKMYVRKMILAETLILALASSFVGVSIAGVVLTVIGVNGIPASNEFLSVLFGGDALYPFLSLSAAVQAVSVMSIGALVACLYPLAIALKVSPLKAMQG